MGERVCLVPRLSGVGGMVSFQAKLTAGLEARGFEICYSLSEKPYQSVLVIGGTRDLVGLWHARREGIPVVQRLNGMNWIHRKRRTGLRHHLRSEYGNLLLEFIRTRLASRIVYQSNFSQHWWERVYGYSQIPCSVVYNGVNLDVYTPDGEHQRPDGYIRILMVEGNLGGGYEGGLDTAVQLVKRLNREDHLPIELMVVGRVSPELQKSWLGRVEFPLIFSGLVPPQMIPAVDRSAHLLFAADLNAACPNSTIEAMACGLPVIAYDTGALPELVTGDAGRIARYGGDSWELEPPDINGLGVAALEVINDQSRFRSAVRRRALELFGLERMVDGYLEALREGSG